MTDPTRTGLTAVEAAERLGVARATIYAYASRGALTRRAGPDARQSRYDPDEVELLARKGRPRSLRRRSGAVDVVIGTTISEIGDGWIRYRGHDLQGLQGRPYEHVAHLLWTGDLPDRSAPVRWPAVYLASTAAGQTDSSPMAGLVTVTDPDAMAGAADPSEAAARAAAALPASAPVSSRLAVGAAAASSLLPADEPRAAADLVDALVAALPLRGPDPGRAASVAARLWPRFSPLAATRARVAALDLALVVLAEHELATSTLAVRVAASTGAGPAEALLAGLGTVSGPLHGRAAGRVHRRLGTGTPSELDPRPHADGFGHLVHQGGDPRFEPLADAVRGLASPSRWAVVEADLARHRAAGAAPPNIDAALGALAFVARAEPGTTEAVFAIARTAGWLAHAFEEADELPLRYRGRTLYRGPR